MTAKNNEVVGKALTHLDGQGQVHMVDVGAKPETKRVSLARGRITMHTQTYRLIQNASIKKGDVLATARVAAIMACKKTAELIPLCHPISLSHAHVQFEFLESDNAIECQVQCETKGQTGVEMEALTGVQIALLTIYDMCKAVDKDMEITNVCLVKKEGGKSGNYTRPVYERRAGEGTD